MKRLVITTKLENGFYEFSYKGQTAKVKRRCIMLALRAI